jgi:hypothetical protein
MMEGSSPGSALHACSKRCPNRQGKLQPTEAQPGTLTVGGPREPRSSRSQWSFRSGQNGLPELLPFRFECKERN